MPYATSVEFLDRVDDVFLHQLAAPDGGGAPDAARITIALEDATAELDGWLTRVPPGRHPAAETLRAHAIKVALYLLTLNTPVTDVDQIRLAYLDTVEFYKALVEEANGSSAGGGGRSHLPCAAFDDETLKGYV